MDNTDLMLSELLKPRNYIPNFLKIRDKNANLIPFVLNEAQRELMSVIEQLKKQGKPIRIIILKARQLGFSTFTEALIFHDTTTNPLKNSLIVAHEDAASQNLYQMYRTYYENLPPELSPMTKYSNSQEMLFENPTQDINEKRKNPGLQSRVKIASARNITAGRSSTIHNLHASEVAFWNDAKTLMTGLMQTIPDSPNSMIILESTANGVGGWFYDTWNDAVSGENDFIPLFFPWFMEPTYSRRFSSIEERNDFCDKVVHTFKDKDGNDVHTEEYMLREAHNLTFEQLNWRRYIIRNNCSNDVEQFRQEYPSTPEEAFIASGRPRFAVGVLKQYLTACKQGERGYLRYAGGSVVFVPDEKGYIEIWEHPKEDMFYAIGADVAEGLIEGDYSAAYVGNDNYDIKAKWYGHIDPDLYGVELVKLAKYYNDAYIGVEANNHGLTTLKAIQHEDYYNIYFAKIYDKIAEKVTQKIGWQTTSRTKPLMIDKLAEFIREKYIGIKDKTFVREALTYIIEENGSTNAQEGTHDDTVMAMGILVQVLLEGKSDLFTPEKEKGTEPPAKRRIDDVSTECYDEKDDDFENRAEISI